MSRRKQALSRNEIQQREHEGYGRGEGKHYRPWLDVKNVPSQGLSHRIKGTKTQREHQLMSNGERDCFYVFEWSEKITDIREQYPLLPLEATIAIAEELGVKHPSYQGNPIVMTTDFMLTVAEGFKKVNVARTFKTTSELNAKADRILEKLEIERVYWQSKNIDWALITEREIPTNLAINARLLLQEGNLEGYPLSNSDIDTIASWLTSRINHRYTSLRQVTLDCDKTLGFEFGTSLRVAYYLMLTHYWEVDMNILIQPDTQLVLL